MSLTSPPAIKAELLKIAESAPASDYVVPGVFAPQRRAELVRDIQTFLHGTVLLHLSTLGPTGWPVTHCMHFASMVGADQSLVIYMFTQDNTRKLVNIQANPRVSLALFRPAAGSPPEKTPYLRMNALATVITDEDERTMVFDTMRAKPGFDFAKKLRLEDQPLLRADVLLAIWEDPANDVPAGTLDVSAGLRPRA